MLLLAAPNSVSMRLTRSRFEVRKVEGTMRTPSSPASANVLAASACVGGLAMIGFLELASQEMYGGLGFTVANTGMGVLSAVVDNIPIMFAVLKMDPTMDHGQWLLITLTAGVGGSLLSIGSAAGVALMGASRGLYTFTSHLRWTPAIALGYVASVLIQCWLNSVLVPG